MGTYAKEDEEIDNEEVELMDDKELEQQISTLIENAPIENEHDEHELSLSSEDEFIVHTSSSNSLNAVKEEENATTTMTLSEPQKSDIKATYSPKGGGEENQSNKSSTIESVKSNSSNSTTLSDTQKKEDLLTKNDEYIARKMSIFD